MQNPLFACLVCGDQRAQGKIEKQDDDGRLVVLDTWLWDPEPGPGFFGPLCSRKCADLWRSCTMVQKLGILFTDPARGIDLLRRLDAGEIIQDHASEKDVTWTFEPMAIAQKCGRDHGSAWCDECPHLVIEFWKMSGVRR